MKKIIFIMMLAVVCSFAISSCTEETIQPTADHSGATVNSDGKN